MTTTSAFTRSASTPPCKKPLAAYLRLTVDRDGKKIGYDVQMAAIQKWADYAGETIGEWYKDKDITAADANVRREEYERMLADIEAGKWRGIVVWRLDRLVRLMYEFERAHRIVENAGGLIVALDPALIRSDEEMGKIFMRLLVMFAEMEIAGMKARALGHRRERARKGLAHGGGPRPFGFAGAIRDKDGRYLNVGKVGVEHNAAEVELMREAARRIAYEGWSWTDVLKDWNSRKNPVIGTTGSPFSITTLQTCLTSLRAAGLREFEEENQETGEMVISTRKATWEAIIDQPTWERLRILVKKREPSGPKHEYVLSGLAVCDTCSMPVGGRHRQVHRKSKVTDAWTYYCKSGPNERKKGRCGKNEARQGPVEAIVQAAVIARLNESPQLLQSLHAEPTTADEELAQAYAIIEDCDIRLGELADAYALPTGHPDRISMIEWRSAREPIQAQKADAERLIDQILNRAAIPMPTQSDWERLDQWYERMLMSQRRTLIKTMFTEVRLRPGKPSGPKFDPNRVVLTPREPEKA